MSHNTPYTRNVTHGELYQGREISKAGQQTHLTVELPLSQMNHHRPGLSSQLLRRPASIPCKNRSLYLSQGISWDNTWGCCLANESGPSTLSFHFHRSKQTELFFLTKNGYFPQLMGVWEDIYLIWFIWDHTHYCWVIQEDWHSNVRTDIEEIGLETKPSKMHCKRTVQCFQMCSLYRLILAHKALLTT